LSLYRLEILDGRDVEDTEFDSEFGAGEHLPMVIGLHGGEFFRAVDWLIVKDAVQLKGELQRRDVDVEFSVDGVLAVEVKFKVREKKDELFGKPAFEF
jgi:hypothetical protein